MSQAVSWILQFNPKEFDFQRYLHRIQTGQSEAEGEWHILRYFHQMKAGDPIFFWQSGPAGGLVARGELLSSAYHRQVENERDWFVGYRLTHLITPSMTRQDLLQDPVLSEISLLKRPQNNCFRLNAQQTQQLDKQLDTSLHVLSTPAEKPSLAKIIQRIQYQGLNLSDDVIRRYHLALNSSSLVILSGPSGIGKSWLTQAYAQATQSHYQLVPVAPNWLSPEDLLGYMHPLQQVFMPTLCTQFLQKASQHYLQTQNQGTRAQNFYLILDEINLARIEHYFAPLLSLLEVRRQGAKASLTLADGSNLLLTPNIFFIGTLNLDETTYHLSDKVCDRAQIIELELDPKFISQKLDHCEWGRCLLELYPDLQAIAPFAYRTLEDIQHYIEAAQQMGIPWQKALDEQITQKVLTRLRLHRQSAPPIYLRLVENMPESFYLSKNKLNQWLQSLEAQGFDNYI